DFFNDTDSNVEQLKSFSDEDVAVARRCAHSIKGLAASLGAKQLTEFASQAENAAAERKIEVVRGLVPQLETELAAVQKALRLLLEEQTA
ncbi:MAG: Hpt domain-containing protein, partial [Planctomycetales bacterium]